LQLERILQLISHSYGWEMEWVCLYTCVRNLSENALNHDCNWHEVHQYWWWRWCTAATVC
jgi:hypothetical protein